ncbi:hypothetical protein RchiOBHm_Chr1g0357821 [Rosa chinensis]|uniref:Uncharacterized protein n=1 Tax=Rosa chinensis TaxID=74649 RepID=A0A2P6SHZ9_ROSCH|nr:hypothetical protein RchiOBHm_Chr1g0357821 [Rosa chinensis]
MPRLSPNPKLWSSALHQWRPASASLLSHLLMALQRRSYAVTTKSSLHCFITMFASHRSTIDEVEITWGSIPMRPKTGWVREWDFSIRPGRARLKSDLIWVEGAYTGASMASLLFDPIMAAVRNRGADQGGLKTIGDWWRQVSDPYTRVRGIGALQPVNVTGAVARPIGVVQAGGANGVRYAKGTATNSHSMAVAEGECIHRLDHVVTRPSVFRSYPKPARSKARNGGAAGGGVPKSGWVPRSVVWPKSIWWPNCFWVSNFFWVPKLTLELKIKVLGSNSRGFRIWDPGGWTQLNILVLTWMARRDFSFLLNYAYVLCSSFFIVIGLLSFVSTDCLISGASMPRSRLAHKWQGSVCIRAILA